MPLNAVCTVIRTVNEAYEKIGVYPCMWQETESFEVKEYGVGNADIAIIFIPGISADVQKEDYIFKGEITGEIDVSKALTVMSVTRCDYGSADMQHTELRIRWRRDLL